MKHTGNTKRCSEKKRKLFPPIRTSEVCLQQLSAAFLQNEKVLSNTVAMVIVGNLSYQLLVTTNINWHLMDLLPSLMAIFSTVWICWILAYVWSLSHGQLFRPSWERTTERGSEFRTPDGLPQLNLKIVIKLWGLKHSPKDFFMLNTIKWIYQCCLYYRTRMSIRSLNLKE